MSRSITVVSARGPVQCTAPMMPVTLTGLPISGISPLEQQLNPDISVREMGVMEKCTFCHQRITGGQGHGKR